MAILRKVAKKKSKTRNSHRTKLYFVKKRRWISEGAQSEHNNLEDMKDLTKDQPSDTEGLGVQASNGGHVSKGINSALSWYSCLVIDDASSNLEKDKNDSINGEGKNNSTLSVQRIEGTMIKFV